MSLSTYTDLKDTVQAMIARSDLNAYIQGWVTAAELYVVNALRVREMETVDNTLTPTSGVIALPSDFLAVNELRLADDLSVGLIHEPSTSLFNREDDEYDEGYGYWDIIGSNLYVRPMPSDTQTYWLSYIARPAALTETSQETNSIFPTFADLYLYGTLWRAYNFVRAYDKADINKAELAAMIQTYNQQAIEEKQGTGSLTMFANQVA